MKAKHIITTCGIILGGLAVAQSASAVVTYRDSANVQFTFAPMLSLSLSGTDGTDLTISDLAPGTTGISNIVTANVATNNMAGYILSATVGGATTALTRSDGGTINMIGSSDTELSSGTWGLTTDGGNTYKALNTSTGMTLAQSDGPTGGSTQVQIGAFPAAGAAAGAYTNTVNFAVTSKVSTYTVAAATGTGAATATIDGGATKVMNPGETAEVTATCTSGTFARWDVSGIGSVASESTVTTTFTAGNGAATVTAYCN